MAVEIPEDIIFGICEELFLREDFSTLYNCALASKRLAQLACNFLYRIYSESSVSDEETEGFEAVTKVQRWSIMWRSIILSATDGTILPYYQYLRYLNLRDLQALLEDNKWTSAVEKKFFAAPLTEIKHTVASRYGGRARLVATKIIDDIGDMIAPKSPMLEQLSGGPCTAAALQRWIPMLPRLQSLELWDGSVLADERFQNAIIENCPHFKALTMYQWREPSSDTHLGDFLMKLPPQTLETLITFNRCGVASETCLALNRHNQTLRDVRLVFESDAVAGMSLVGEVLSLRKLELEIPSSVDLKATQNDVFTQMLTWLGQCVSLRELTLNEFINGPELVMPLLLNDDAQLEEVSLNAQRALYSMKDNRDFHLSLPKQQSLRSLILKGDGDEVTRDDVDALVESVSKLKGLRRLKLHGVSDYFNDGSISTLFESLPNLEEVFIGGYGVSDAVLLSASRLSRLRTLNLFAVSSFTTDGLLDFIEKLQPSNEGLRVEVDMADPSSLITEEDLEVVRSVLREKVKGRLEYIPMRDPDVSEFEGESD